MTTSETWDPAAGTWVTAPSDDLEAMVNIAAQAVEDCVQEAMPSRVSQMRCFYDRISEATLHQHLRDALRPEVERVQRELAEATEQLRRQGEVVEAARALTRSPGGLDYGKKAVALLDALIRLDAAVAPRVSTSISAGVRYPVRPCEHCHRPFPRNRRDKRFCGKQCREAAGYRTRTNRAIDLADFVEVQRPMATSVDPLQAALEDA